MRNKGKKISNQGVYYWLLILGLLVLLLFANELIYRAVEKNPKYIYKAASDNMFDTNFFFNGYEELQKNIVSEVYNGKDTAYIVSNDILFWKYINENPMVIRRIVSNNETYINYLSSIDYSVDNVVDFANTFNECYEDISKIIIYIWGLLVAFFTLLIFKYRSSFYFVIVVLSILITLGTLSGGLTNIILFDLIKKLDKETTYSIFTILQNFFSAVILESFMTMTFLDVIIQFYQSRKENASRHQIVYCSRWLMTSINLQIEWFEKNKDKVSEIRCFVKSREWPVYPIEKKCKSILKESSKNLKRQEKYCRKNPGKGAYFYQQYKGLVDESRCLIDFFEFIRCNDKSLPLEYYIQRFEKAKESMYYLGFGNY